MYHFFSLFSSNLHLLKIGPLMSLKARMTYINVNKCNLSFLSLYVGLNPQHSESKVFSFYFLMICEIK